MANTITTTYTKVSAQDEQVQALASKTGMKAEDIAAVMNKEAYRKAYSQRSDVKAKRAEYTRARNEQLQVVAQLLKGVK